MHEISEEQIRVRAYQLWELAEIGRVETTTDFGGKLKQSWNFCKPATK